MNEIMRARTRPKSALVALRKAKTAGCNSSLAYDIDCAGQVRNVLRGKEKIVQITVFRECRKQQVIIQQKKHVVS
jgi:hypothetical protein